MWRKRKPEDFQAELDAHLQLEADELRADGAPDPDLAARRALGNRTSAEERFYEGSRWMFGQHLLRDLRFALRVLSKEPKFSILTILGLALGIGVSTAIFGLVNSAKVPHGSGFRSADPARDPSTYVSIDRSSDYPATFSYPEYRYFQDHATAVSDITAESDAASLILGPISKAADGEEVVARFESANFLSVRGFQPALGRSFSPDEDKTAAPVALLSYSFWQTHLGSDPAIVGKNAVVNDHPVTTIGVTDPRFHASDSAELFLPLGLQPLLLDQSGIGSDGTTLMLNGRLRPGVSIAQAEAEAEADLLATAFDRASPAKESTGKAPPRMINPAPIVYRGSISPKMQRQNAELMLAVGLAVGMILFIACSNLASLLLARSTVRRRELGVRLSLGASRSRLIGQLLTESLLLSITGGVLGIVLANWLGRGMLLALPSASGISFQLDGRVLGFALLLSLLTGFSFGLGPALAATKMDLARALHSSGLHGELDTAAKIGWSRRNLLVVVPLALSLMLLIGSALLIRAAQSTAAVSLSFDPSRIIGLSFRLSSQGYDEAKAKQFELDLRDRVATIPGVASSAITDMFFMFGGTCNAQDVYGACHFVSPSFFETIGVSILRGRGFLPSDHAGSPPVAIVNREFVRRNWPDRDPVGQQIQTGQGSVEVVGVANDLAYAQHVGIFPPSPTVYLPLDQSKPPARGAG
ncbi:MAG TPA: ABC transporter permease, partial [Bryobacteraceae bacterium]|nr:ABC transporter permease [Bryobacteraceae bacterium]